MYLSIKSILWKNILKSKVKVQVQVFYSTHEKKQNNPKLFSPCFLFHFFRWMKCAIEYHSKNKQCLAKFNIRTTFSLFNYVGGILMSWGTVTPHKQTFWFQWRSWTRGSSSAEADFQKCPQLAVLFLGWRWDLLCWTAFRKLQKQAEVCWVWQTTWEPQETSWESWCHLLSRPGMNQAAWWRLVFCGNFSGCGRSLPHQMSQIQHLLKWKDPPTAAWCSPTLKHREGDTSISTVTFLLDKFNYIYDIFPNSKGINNISLTNNTIRNKRPKLAKKKKKRDIK